MVFQPASRQTQPRVSLILTLRTLPLPACRYALLSWRVRLRAPGLHAPEINNEHLDPHHDANRYVFPLALFTSVHAQWLKSNGDGDGYYQ